MLSISSIYSSFSPLTACNKVSKKYLVVASSSVTVVFFSCFPNIIKKMHPSPSLFSFFKLLWKTLTSSNYLSGDHHLDRFIKLLIHNEEQKVSSYVDNTSFLILQRHHYAGFTFLTKADLIFFHFSLHSSTEKITIII